MLVYFLLLILHVNFAIEKRESILGNLTFDVLITLRKMTISDCG